MFRSPGVSSQSRTGHQGNTDVSENRQRHKVPFKSTGSSPPKAVQFGVDGACFQSPVLLLLCKALPPTASYRPPPPPNCPSTHCLVTWNHVTASVLPKRTRLPSRTIMGTDLHRSRSSFGIIWQGWALSIV